MPTANNLNDVIELFPDPSNHISSSLPIPAQWPGITPESTEVLKEILNDTHKKYHCYFDKRGFHNHTAHTALALWALGADQAILKNAYARGASYQKPAFASPGSIDSQNWTEHLGDDQYYDAYMSFFSREVASKGLAPVVEEYIFAVDAQGFGTEMLDRFLASLLHPIIHVGYGFEFNLPGMVIEGLAHTAIHPAISGELIPARWFKEDTLVADNSTSSALNILARVLENPGIVVSRVPDERQQYHSSLKKNGRIVAEHVNAYIPDVSSMEATKKTLEEVVLAIVLMYTVPGLTHKDEGMVFNADFFYMHLVTCSIFLSSLLSNLKPKSQVLLLRGYLSTCLIWYVAFGKPQINIPKFFEQNTLKSLLTSESSYDFGACLKDLPSSSLSSPNPWLEIIHRTLVHPDDHLRKLQRTLAHFSQVYGHRKAGYFSDCELKGAEKIDGTLFIRAANLTMARLNREDKAEVVMMPIWDRRGFYDDN